jgi:hypothetical protein
VLLDLVIVMHLRLIESAMASFPSRYNPILFLPNCLAWYSALSARSRATV